ncbi:MAG TPA: MarR family transcriptional regulator [Candidatus Limnocylindrales bacterium]|jgi:DNA-binding MarR family transcriptional regulator|nr:MarR family transcriptional regulator [Candidatus Limnocylindrales bacterium]
MARDFTDRLIDRWAQIRPDLGVGGLQVTARLARLGRHVALREEEVFGRFGLNRGEVGVLSALRIAGPPHRLSPTRIGKGLMLSSAGVTTRLDRLEKRGLVTRLPDPDDRRGVIVELSDRGLELVDEAVGANTASEQQILARLDPEELATLESLLRKVLATIEPPEVA